ncbi:hypothetical protein [Oxalicibacterium faecigallinarum]|uniref:hypothetical protein n=1 Tax=Oxalicibacterium faecigallinarum TaxID=573741 RepID=UPI0016634CDF|nr:hypothetical protein [Oxalicibacterium faecigallinarum]
MDDSQDKVRRNLVVASSLVLLAQILNIEIKEDASIGIFAIRNVTDDMFWVLACAVLFYLFQRYWFDDATAMQSKRLTDDFKNWMLKQIRWIVQRHAKEAVIRKGPYGCISKIFLDNVLFDGVVEVSVSIPVTEFAVSRIGTCNVNVSIHSQTADRNTVAIRSVVVEYRLGLIDSLFVICLPLTRLAVFSKGYVDFVLPLMLWFSAFICCIARVYVVLRQ